ncbi:MAG: carboxypeptidase regulatory-like domain-containing protein [bacterium]|nr:carboxypeptidase regulatory-like domain-containing protein [bacterium]
MQSSDLQSSRRLAAFFTFFLLSFSGGLGLQAAENPAQLSTSPASDTVAAAMRHELRLVRLDLERYLRQLSVDPDRRFFSPGRLAEFHWRLGPIERRLDEWTEIAPERRESHLAAWRADLGRLSADVRGALEALGPNARKMRGTGAIAGFVTDGATGAGIAHSEVLIYDANGKSVDFATAGPSGAYLVSGLPTGSYFAVTWNRLGYLNELYDDLPCFPFCDVTGGTPIVLEPGTIADGIDFRLDPGGTVSGTIRDAATGAGIDASWVNFYDADGNWVTAAAAGAAGEYRSPVGLVTGHYFALSGNDPGYLNELYDDAPCPACDVTTGTPVAVAAGQVASGVDFALELGGAISGRVTDSTTGLGIGSIYIDIFDSAGVFQTNGFTDAAGDYLSFVDLAPGIYYARTAGGHAWVNELYDGITCMSCDVTTGTPIVVSSGATTAGIDFTLEPGGTLSGWVIDSATGRGIEDLWIHVFDRFGIEVTSGVTDAAGAWRTSFASLVPGTYYARTAGRRYLNEVYDDLPCHFSCEVTKGTPIAVFAGGETDSVDFALDRVDWEFEKSGGDLADDPDE